MSCICGHITKTIASTIVRVWRCSWSVWTASCHDQIERLTLIIGCMFESDFLRATVGTFASKVVVDRGVAIQIEFCTTSPIILTNRAIRFGPNVQSIFQMHPCLQQRQTFQIAKCKTRNQRAGHQRMHGKCMPLSEE